MQFKNVSLISWTWSTAVNRVSLLAAVATSLSILKPIRPSLLFSSKLIRSQVKLISILFIVSIEGQIQWREKIWILQTSKSMSKTYYWVGLLCLKKDSNCFKLVTRLLTSNLNALFQIRPAALKFVNDFSTNSQCQKQFSALRNYTAME